MKLNQRQKDILLLNREKRKHVKSRSNVISDLIRMEDFGNCGESHYYRFNLERLDCLNYEINFNTKMIRLLSFGKIEAIK